MSIENYYNWCTLVHGHFMMLEIKPQDTVKYDESTF
jgi:hypothetical protein